MLVPDVPDVPVPQGLVPEEDVEVPDDLLDPEDDVPEELVPDDDELPEDDLVPDVEFELPLDPELAPLDPLDPSDEISLAEIASGSNIPGM